LNQIAPPGQSRRWAPTAFGNLEMRTITLTILFLSLLVLSASNAHACSCADPSQREKFRKADYVFLGQVVDIADSNVEDFGYAVKFKIEKQWKGPKMPEPIVDFTYDRPGWCGDLNLAKGERFLIYAYREKQNLISYTDCGPNMNVKYAEASIKNLNSFWFRLFARAYPF
jgi:hypothetical protein